MDHVRSPRLWNLTCLQKGLVAYICQALLHNRPISTHWDLKIIQPPVVLVQVILNLFFLQKLFFIYFILKFNLIFRRQSISSTNWIILFHMDMR